MKFGKYLESEAIPEWRPKYLNYFRLKEIIRDNHENERGNMDEESATIIPGGHAGSGSNRFFHVLQVEMRKVEEFHSERFAELLRKANQLFTEAERKHNGTQEAPAARTTPTQNHIQKQNQATQHLASSPAAHHDLTNDLAHGSRHHLKLKVKKASLLLYTEIQMIRSFRSLNQQALQKILKKYIKRSELTTSNSRLDDPLSQFHFKIKEGEALDEIQRRLEDTFTATFCDGDRHEAMRQLRVKDLKHQTFHAPALISGAFWTATMALIITQWLKVSDLATQSKSPHPLRLFYLHLGLFLPLLLLNLFPWEALICNHFHINYPFIFRFNPRTLAHPFQLAALFSSCGLLYWVMAGVSLHVSLGQGLGSESPGPQLLYLGIKLLPLMTCTVYALLPIPIFMWQSRGWFWSRLTKALTAPLSPVEFADFFLADQLVSFPFFWICLFWPSETASHPLLLLPSSSGALALTAAAPAIPYVWRLFQCLRRYRDTGISQNLLNALKYLLGFSSFFCRALPGMGLPVIRALQVLTAMLCFYWDIVMDFGLVDVRRTAARSLKAKTPFSWLLGERAISIQYRKQLLFTPRRYIYFCFVAIDFLGRCTFLLFWLFPPSTSSSSWIVLQLLSSVAELIRRFQWNLIRLELEHLNNCDAFRAIDDSLPLPFASADLFYQDITKENEDEEDETSGSECTEPTVSSERTHS